MPSILTPLIAVFGIMLLGFIIQKLKVLPHDTDFTLNEYVYYVAFPAILFIALAETDIDEILQWGFIASFGITMLVTYFVTAVISLSADKKQPALAAIRGLNTSFGNTAFIGIPLMMMLYPGNNHAITAAAIASLLSIVMFAFVMVSMELDIIKQQKRHPIIIMLNALSSNPIVIGSVLGVAASALKLPIPDSLSVMMRLIGNTSSPCALFAIGMVLAKAMHGGEEPSETRHHIAIEMTVLNMLKLVFQPVIAYALLRYFNVDTELLIMGVILAALPTAASVYLLAQRYQTYGLASAKCILISTIATFITLPIIEKLLHNIN
ncbi:AEC family transporter [Shewanella electrodiphila]|uniref:AEC family transporter n=1 Tax=Shewanella electrodiphila TaxID=934143 RepID=A0ABT0KLJ1_9GAMM|nr:AEC family transporter [Shewanella electrodiphila]MCL1044644.1 AEC family transporter [Shewanella electrodiphila]